MSPCRQGAGAVARHPLCGGTTIRELTRQPLRIAVDVPGTQDPYPVSVGVLRKTEQ